MSARRRIVVVVTSLALLGGAAAGASAYTRAFRPPADGGVGGLEGATSIGSGTAVAHYRDRTVVRGLLALRNDSRVAMRIERVGRRGPDEWRGLVDFRPGLDTLAPPGGVGYGDAPFAPFTLRPGQVRTVGVALWLDHCEHNVRGSATTVTSVPVRYAVLGMTRNVDVRLSTGWEVRLDGARCPRATLSGTGT